VTRILVAEDRIDYAEEISGLFAALGYQTKVARDGYEAVALTAAFHPHVVFMDLDMPRMNGYDAALAIRRDIGLRQPRLIALTAAHGVSVQVATKAAGFDSCIKKPFDTFALVAIVTDLANQHDH
jgi:CheY-like chemotaxis protein